MHSSRANLSLDQKTQGSNVQISNGTNKPTPVKSRRQFLLQAGQIAAATLLSGCALSRPEIQVDELANNFVLPDLELSDRADAAFVPPLPDKINPSLRGSAISLDVKIGQMILAGFSGQRLTGSSAIINDVAQNRVGSVALFGRNIVDAEQLKLLTASLQNVAAIPLLISVDQEGGLVSRVGSRFGLPRSYSAAHLGRLNDLGATQSFAIETAKTLRSLGINLNLAPVVDLNTNPSNPVIGSQGRSFSHDPQVVTEQALAFIEAHHQEGVFCTLKHFPGHGSSTADSHLGFVDVTETWSADELTPFASIIQSGRCDAVMTAHIFNAKLDSEHPATLSNRVITGILRERLGYDGVIMTDDIQMGAIRNFYAFDQAIELSLNAGVDIFSISRYSPALVDRVFSTVHRLIDSGRISEERIDSSFVRILTLKSRLEIPWTLELAASPIPIETPTEVPTEVPTPTITPATAPTATAIPTATIRPELQPSPTPGKTSEPLEKLDNFLH